MLIREKGLDKRVYDENDEVDKGKQEIAHIIEAIAASTLCAEAGKAPKLSTLDLLCACMQEEDTV